MPESTAPTTYLTWIASRAEAPMYSTRISLSFIAGSSRPERRVEHSGRPAERGDAGHAPPRPAGHVAHRFLAGPHAEHRRWQHVEAVGRTERLALHQQAVEDHRQREATAGRRRWRGSAPAGSRGCTRHTPATTPPVSMTQQHVADAEEASDRAARVRAEAVVTAPDRRTPAPRAAAASGRARPGPWRARRSAGTSPTAAERPDGRGHREQ